MSTEDNNSFQLFKLAELPISSDLHKDPKADTLLKEYKLIGGEGHVAASLQVDQNLDVYWFGGSYPENYGRSDSCAKIYKTSFSLDEKGAVAQTEKAVVHHSTQPHLKNQYGPKATLMSGSPLKLLSFPSMNFDKEGNLWIFHGYHYKRDCNTDDVYVVKNITDSEAESEVILCPGNHCFKYLVGEQAESIRRGFIKTF